MLLFAYFSLIYCISFNLFVYISLMHYTHTLSLFSVIILFYSEPQVHCHLQHVSDYNASEAIALGLLIFIRFKNIIVDMILTQKR